MFVDPGATVLVGSGVFVFTGVAVLVEPGAAVLVGSGVRVFSGVAVFTGVGVFVEPAGTVFVTVGVLVEATMQFEAAIVLEIKVTAPLRARSRPFTVAVLVRLMSVKARTLPLRLEPTPSVAELPTCQKTLQA